MAQALGYRLLDAAGHELARGGAALARLERIDPSAFDATWISRVVHSAPTLPVLARQLAARTVKRIRG